MEVIQKRNEVTGREELMTDRRFKDILDQGFTDEYDAVKFQMSRDSSFGLDDKQKSMQRLYLDAQSRSNETSGSIAGPGATMSAEYVACCNCNCDQHAPRDVAMSAASEVCHQCNKQGHYKRNCLELLLKNKGKRETTKKHPGGKGGSGGGAGQTWCSHQNTTTHCDSECYAQGALRPQPDSAYTTCSTQCNHPSPDGDAETLELNFGHDLDGGFL